MAQVHGSHKPFIVDKNLGAALDIDKRATHRNNF